MSTNRKPAQQKEAPQEPFKRAVAGAMRAMAKTPKLEVTFAPERPSLIGSADGAKARLPEPPRKLSLKEASIVRGHADSIALRLACHDDAVHRRLAPATTQARAAFDALEQARVECIGSRRMAGVADNISAMLDDRYQRGQYADITSRDEAPLEDALALLARQRLTGLPPPPHAAKLVEFWRQWIEERAGSDLDKLSGTIENQRGFGQLVQKLLAHLEMMSDEAQKDEDSDESAEEAPQNPDESEGEDQDDQESSSAADLETAAATEDAMQEGESDSADAPYGESQDQV